MLFATYSSSLDKTITGSDKDTTLDIINVLALPALVVAMTSAVCSIEVFCGPVTAMAVVLSFGSSLQ